MKKTMLFLTGMLLTLFSSVQAQVPAFPGADGYGRYTKGGRGGSVYYVTTLEDGNVPGTLRYAVENLSNVTVLFKVSGTIHLNKQLNISKPNITIAGQSAPGDGICLADYPVMVNANNIIVRYLRFRMGDEKVTVDEAEGADAFGGRFCHNVIIDHCSISWCTDECASFYANYDFTMQWCIISESLRMSKHPKQAHGYGAIWGGLGASYYHNMIIHHDSRTPRFGTGNVMPLEDHKTDMRNNVIYNWSGNGCYGAEGMYINMVNNYWKPGPATTSSSKNRFIGIDDATPGDGKTSVWGKYYITGNVNTKYSNITNDNWAGVIINSTTLVNGNPSKNDLRSDEPLGIIPEFHQHTAQDAYAMVLDYAGCSLRRDAIDERLITECRNGTATFKGASANKGGIIDSQTDLKPAGASNDWSPWPVLIQTEAPTDTDGDGMPDSWEKAHGLDANDANDGNLKNEEGYTMLEVYLNALVDEITEKQYAGAVLMGEPAQAINGGNLSTDVTIKWTMDSGCSGEKGSASDDTKVTSAEYSMTENLTIKEKRTVQGTTFTLFQPTAETKSPVESAVVTYNICLPEGIEVIPSKICFHAVRFGTSGGYIDTKWVDGDGKETILEAGFNPVASNSSDSPLHEIDLTENIFKVSKETCELRLYIYRLANTKQVGIANMEIGLHLSDKSGIYYINADEPSSVTYYDIHGRQVSKDSHGIIIKKENCPNGKISTHKFFNN